MQFLPPKLKRKKTFVVKKPCLPARSPIYIVRLNSTLSPFDILQRQMLKSHIHSPQYFNTQPYIFHEVLSCRALLYACEGCRGNGERRYERKCAGPLRNCNAVAPKGKERRAGNLVKNLSNVFRRQERLVDNTCATSRIRPWRFRGLARTNRRGYIDKLTFDANHRMSRDGQL